MKEKVDIEELAKYKAFLSNYSNEVTSLTDICLQKASFVQDKWQDVHIDEVINELTGLRLCIDSFSESCERHCHVLQEIIDRYRVYLSGRFSGN